MTPPENSPKAQEVKACPFCASEARIVWWSDDTKENQYWITGCSSGRCIIYHEAGMTRYFNSEKEAIKAWNTRAPNENQDVFVEKAPTTPQIHPKTGWMKIIDRDAGWNTVYYSKQACELSCENDHHCKGIQEVEIRPAQSEGNREKELEDALEWLAGSDGILGKHDGIYIIVKIRNGTGKTLGEGSTPLLAIQNAMNSQGGSK